jgi:SRSO17 transposase
MMVGTPSLEWADRAGATRLTGLPVLALQRFLTASPWRSADVQREIQAVFAEQVVPAALQGPGTVGVIDGSGFIKKGTASVGVDRQYCGRLGAIANCQVGSSW